jgi:predicted metal-dependent phosphoesterase TrpH
MSLLSQQHNDTTQQSSTESWIVDLHCHSYFSDGLLAPDALLTKALDANIKVLALTDHDTLAGLTSLMQAARVHPIHIIPGLEWSVRWKTHDIHVLGLNIDPQNQHLLHCIQQQEERRIARAKQISVCLSKFGVANAYEKICERIGHACAGRPHFAQLLVEEGVVPDIKRGFQRFLARGKPAYVSTTWLSLEDVVDATTQAGGGAVIAHPLKYKLTRTKLHALINAFKSVGGVGMEVVSGFMTMPQVTEMAHLCNRFELFASTGSDYHGDGVSRLGLGKQYVLPVDCTPVWSQWDLH